MDVEEALRDEFRNEDWGAPPWEAPVHRLRHELRRRRQWRASIASVVLIVGAMGTGFAIVSSGNGGGAKVTPQHLASPTPTSVPAHGHGANASGLAGVGFGTSQTRAERQLVQLFGPPRRVFQRQPLPPACGIDTATVWHKLIAYYFRQRFVGYIYQGPTPQRGRNLRAPNGLYVGEALSKAEAAGGKDFVWSYAQGGSWTLRTPLGKLVGNLTAVPPHGDIANIAAGSLGCAAMTP